MRNKDIELLRELRRCFKSIDDDLRNTTVCRLCGKPKCGIVLAGETKESSGLCTCREGYMDSFREEEQ